MHQEDQIQKFTYGNATFKFNSQIIRKIIEESKDVRSRLKNKKWNISFNCFQRQNWQEIFLHMSECFAQKLILLGNKKNQIISQIQYVQYSNLKQLYLQGNNIDNIQSLSFIHFNCLQQLDLGHNKISQIKCLNKLSILSLNNINLDQNPLNEINALTSSKINFKQFIKPLRFNFFSFKNPVNLDQSMIVKLSSKQVEYLTLYSVFRISQVKVRSILKLRFPSLKN